MANPILEEGYTRIANELYKALYMAELSGSELRIVHFVLYNTYGYNRNTRTLTASYISRGTGISIKTVRNSLNSLVEYKVLFSIGSKESIKMFGINKNYEQWIFKKGKKLPKIGGTQKQAPPTQKQAPLKEKNEQRVPENGEGGTQIQVGGVPENGYQYKTDNTRQNKSIQSSNSCTPTMDDVEKYCKEKNYTFDVNKFFCHYQSFNWKYKGKPIEDWKALADRWQNNERNYDSKYSFQKKGGSSWSYEGRTNYDIDYCENYSMFDEMEVDEIFGKYNGGVIDFKKQKLKQITEDLKGEI